jgi:plastocyanin
MEQTTINQTQFEPGDIQVGDEILFNHVDTVEHNLFWKVVNKISHSSLVVEIREMGYAQKLMVEIKDIIILQKNGQTFKQLSL